MEEIGTDRRLSTKKRPEGRNAVHRGMLINVLMRQCADVPMKLANWLISK